MPGTYNLLAHNCRDFVYEVVQYLIEQNKLDKDNLKTFTDDLSDRLIRDDRALRMFVVWASLIFLLIGMNYIFCYSGTSLATELLASVFVTENNSFCWISLSLGLGAASALALYVLLTEFQFVAAFNGFGLIRLKKFRLKPMHLLGAAMGVAVIFVPIIFWMIYRPFVLDISNSEAASLGSIIGLALHSALWEKMLTASAGAYAAGIHSAYALSLYRKLRKKPFQLNFPPVAVIFFQDFAKPVLRNQFREVASYIYTQESLQIKNEIFVILAALPPKRVTRWACLRSLRQPVGSCTYSLTY